MTRIELNGYAPLERGARNGEVGKTFFEEVVDHFVDARGRLEKIGGGQKLLDSVLILGQAEEIALLFGVDYFSAAVGALAVHELTFRPERFAGRAVLALVVRLVDVALLVELLEYLLHRFDVVAVGSADKLIVGNIEKLPKLLDFAHKLVDERFGRNAGFGGAFFYLLPVLVRAGQVEHVEAAHALVASERVTAHRGVAVT